MPCNDIVFCRFLEALKATSKFTKCAMQQSKKKPVLHCTKNKSMKNLQWKCILNANDWTYLCAIGLPSNVNFTSNA